MVRRYIKIIFFEILAVARQLKEVFPSTTVICFITLVWFYISYALWGVLKLQNNDTTEIRTGFILIASILGWLSINKEIIKRLSLEDRLVSLRCIPISFKILSYIKKKKICCPFWGLFTVFIIINISAYCFVNGGISKAIFFFVLYNICFIASQDIHINAIISRIEGFIQILYLATHLLLMLTIKKWMCVVNNRIVAITSILVSVYFLLQFIFIQYGEIKNPRSIPGNKIYLPSRWNFVIRKDILSIFGDKHKRVSLLGILIIFPLLSVVLATKTKLGNDYPYVTYIVMCLFYCSSISNMLSQELCMGMEGHMIVHYIMSGFPIYKIQLIRIRWLDCLSGVSIVYFSVVSLISIELTFADRLACSAMSLFTAILVNSISGYYSLKYTSYDNEFKIPNYIQSFISYIIKMFVYLFTTICSIAIQYYENSAAHRMKWIVINIILLILLKVLYFIKIRKDNLKYYGDYYNEFK